MFPTLRMTSFDFAILHILSWPSFRYESRDWASHSQLTTQVLHCHIKRHRHQQKTIKSQKKTVKQQKKPRDYIKVYVDFTTDVSF